MNDLLLLRTLTALKLSTAGRHSEAMGWLTPELVGLKALISQQAGENVEPPEGVLGDLVRGWSHYYRAEYAEAFARFSKAEDADVPWIKAYAMIGKAKVCTDLGFFADAIQWCSEASCLARRFEHDDLVAMAQGSRGEILLRAGQPRLAMEAYTLDMALLSPSDRFRGRVMCYQAHAYRRLGSYSAAKLAYRISAKHPGEQTTPYALAGLALLAAETDDVGLMAETVEYAESLAGTFKMHPSVGWIYIAKSRSAQRLGQDPLVWGEKARSHLPTTHIFEHQWLAKWVQSFAGQAESIPPRTMVPQSIRDFQPSGLKVDRIPGWQFDSDPMDATLFNRGLVNLQWSTDVESLWKQSQLFIS